MDENHILLGRPWKYDKGLMQDRRRNAYKSDKDKNKFSLHHLSKQVEKEENVMILSTVKGIER